MEPVYEITVTVPDEYLGDVMSDVSSRRGKIRETGQQGRYQVVTNFHQSRHRCGQAPCPRYQIASAMLEQGGPVLVTRVDPQKASAVIEGILAIRGAAGE